jgi:hypothetical protein
MGLYQQAGVLLLDHRRLHGTHNGAYCAADPEIYGRGANPENPYDIPRYVREIIKDEYSRRDGEGLECANMRGGKAIEGCRGVEWAAE